MGTRADYYIGRGENAEWIGSTAWDGYPSGIDPTVLQATEINEYKERIIEHVTKRDDYTSPADGWPWPWDDSKTTDYAYAFDGGKVWCSCFGSNWFDPLLPEPPEEGDEEESEEPQGKYTDVPAVFPDMTKRKNVALGGKKSGLTVIG